MSSASITYNLSGIRALAGKYPQAFKRETVTVLDLIVRRLESRVEALTPKGVGGAAGLAGSIFGEVKTAGSEIKGIVGTPMAYGIVVEHGRRPGMGMPPVGPIQLWAERKLGLSEEEAKGAAWAIAKKISIRGFDGAEMFGKSLSELEGWIKQMLATLPDRIVRRVNRG